MGEQPTTYVREQIDGDELAFLLGIGPSDMRRIGRVDVTFDNIWESWMISAQLEADDE